MTKKKIKIVEVNFTELIGIVFYFGFAVGLALSMFFILLVAISL